MKIYILMLTLFLSSTGFTAQVSYETQHNASNEFVNVTKVVCEPEEANLCQYMCGQKDSCIREEVVCTNCAGTNDFFLRLVFTKIQDNFVVTDQAWDTSNMIVYLADKNYVLVTYKSVYNFYKTWGSEEVKLDFQTYCYDYSADPIFILDLNEKNQPQNVVGVICSNVVGQSYVRLMRDKNMKKQAKINQQNP